MSKKNLFYFAINDDERLLPKCLFALATGRPSYHSYCGDGLGSNRDTTSNRHALLSTYMANDLILRANRTEETGPCVRSLSHMFDHGSLHQLRNWTTALRLTTSRKKGIDRIPRSSFT